MVCAHCKIEKEVDEFPFRKARNNYSTICKKCKNLYSLKYRKENVERVRKNQDLFLLNNDISTLNKTCNKCGVEKPLIAFSTCNVSSDGRRAICKECSHIHYYLKNKKKYNLLSRKLALKNNFNITIEDYEEMSKSQKDCCYICGTHKSKFKYGLHVDHSHETGKVRALLCKKCNIALGHVNDEIGILEKMIEYLKKFK